MRYWLYPERQWFGTNRRRNTAAPVLVADIAGVTGGAVEIGSTATGVISGLTGGEAIQHGWTLDGAPISGATSDSYVVQTADDLGLLRYAPTVDGLPLQSPGYPVRHAAAINTIAPAIAGTFGLGDVLTVSDGTWTGAVGGSFSYQWRRNDADIPGASAKTYSITTADDAATLTCVVSYTNSGGTVAAAASNSVTVTDFTAPALGGVPTISGTETVGSTLTAGPAPVTGTPTPARSWQWLRSGAPVSGATGASYVLQSADEGQNLSVRQTETNALGTDTAESLVTAAIASGAVPETTFALDFTEATGDEDIDLSAIGPAESGTASYALTPYAGASLVGGKTLRIDTGTAAAGTVTVRRSDDTGSRDLVLALTLVTASINGLTGQITIGDDTRSNAMISVDVTGGNYGGQTVNFTPADLSVPDGQAFNLIAPAVTLTTDADADGLLDDGDIATRVTGLWGYPSAQTAPSISGQWYDQAGAITGETGATYTGDGAETASVFYRESDGTNAADSSPISVDGGVFEAAFVSSYVAGNGGTGGGWSSGTNSAVDIGAADPNRRIYFFLLDYNSSGDVSGVTFNGTAANLLSNVNTGTGNWPVILGYVDLPTGTSAEVIVSASAGSPTQNGIYIFRTVNATSHDHVDVNAQTTTNPHSASIATQVGDFVIAINRRVNAATSWWASNPDDDPIWTQHYFGDTRTAEVAWVGSMTEDTAGTRVAEFSSTNTNPHHIVMARIR